MFIDPEVGAVGLTEDRARATGHEVAVGRQPLDGVARARAIGETRGEIRVVTDSTTGAILGCHVVGPAAADLVHEAVVAMAAGIGVDGIAEAIHTHPSLAEGVNAAAGGVHRPAGQ